MQHYGRGVGKVPMPRALARSPRKEWPVSPSFIIFFLAVLLVLSLKITTSNKKLFKQTKTIIIIPQNKPVPEPTVPKKIPLIKVLKDAVKKTVEPKKMELKKIIPQKVEPKKPLAKKIKPKKIEPLKKLDKKIEPKKLDHNKIKPQKLTPKKIDTKQISQKKLDAAKPLDKKIPEKHQVPKKIETKAVAKKDSLARELPAQRTPKPDIKPKNVDINLDPMVKAPPNVVDRSPAPQFHAMQDLKRKSVVEAPSGQTAPKPRVSLSTPNTGPAPELTQWESYRPNVEVDAPSATGSRIAHKVNTPVAPPPVHQVMPSSAGPVAEDLVIINSRAIGNSDRVKNLKRAIMKKAGKMDPAHSPYTYKVKNYICTLTVEGGAQGKIIIDFTPTDAPFDVVSALERLLPR